MVTVTRVMLKGFFIDSLVGFVICTLGLSLYVLGVVGMSWGQYWLWVLSNLLFSPPLSISIVCVSKYLKRKMLKG